VKNEQSKFSILAHPMSFRDLLIGLGDFIDAYKKGLTGEAAAWVVHKQKSHRSISEVAIKALEAPANK
jgi:hypothetical protein